MEKETSYHIEWESKGAISTLSGELTLDCISRADEEIYSHALFQECDYVICDLRKAGVEKLDLVDSHTIALQDAIISVEKPGLKVMVIINPDDELAVCFAELYIEKTQQLYTSWEFKIFSNIDDAKSWIKSRDSIGRLIS